MAARSKSLIPGLMVASTTSYSFAMAPVSGRAAHLSTRQFCCRERTSCWPQSFPVSSTSSAAEPGQLRKRNSVAGMRIANSDQRVSGMRQSKQKRRAKTQTENCSQTIWMPWAWMHRMRKLLKAKRRQLVKRRLSPAQPRKNLAWSICGHSDSASRAIDASTKHLVSCNRRKVSHWK